MSEYFVKKISDNPDICVTVPGSKSITNRALLLGALAKGKTILRNVLFSEDSRAFIDSLMSLGFDLKVLENENTVEIEGLGGALPSTKASINVGKAGTAARFLTAYLAIFGDDIHIDSHPQMAQRPMDELYTALIEIGACIERHEKSFPIDIKKGSFPDYDSEVLIHLNIDKSSQYLSGLLMILPLKFKKSTIILTGNRKARSYVLMTEQMMNQFGFSGRIESKDENTYIITGGDYKCKDYAIEPDISSACYFYALAALTGGRCKVNYIRKDSLQGDMKFIYILEKMGCKLTWEDSLILYGPKNGILTGIEADFSDFSDQSLTMAAIAPFCESPVRVYGISHIRGQESDRIKAIHDILNFLGLRCDMDEDSFTVYPGAINGGEVETYDDHRVAMSFTVLGLKTGNIIIKNPECCYKTFEGFYDIIDRLIENNK
jgi:3-phosphoshikimate 1-carboxyvinyltransferase